MFSVGLYNALRMSLPSINAFTFTKAHGWRLGAEFGGDGPKKFRGPNFRMTFKGKKIPILTPKNVLWPIFSHRLYFICLFSIYTVWNLKHAKADIYGPYMTLLLTKSLDFRTKHSSLRLVGVSSYLASHPITVPLKIFGGRMHGPSPYLKFWGPSPSPSSPP